MSRRTLPGADELFRTTADSLGLHEASRVNDGAPAPAPGVEPLRAVPGEPGASADGVESAVPGVRHTSVRRRNRQAGDRRPSGRERHDEKITVYVSAEELLDLEQARLTLRGEHGMAVDRGRIVREALAVVLADFDAKGDSSILVRRLRGR